MTIGIYSPYLETYGGGEKYILTIAEILAKDHKVDCLLGTHLYSLDIDKFKEKIFSIHNIDLSKVNFINSPIGKGSASFKRLFFLSKYDILFYLTDGSVFFSGAKKSYIHFQVPFRNSSLKGLTGYLKQLSWKKAIYNSKFTKEEVEKNWPIKGEVIYPPVNTNLFKIKPKKKQIISVGRFFGYLKDKKHSLLIESFIKLISEKEVKDWSLHLVGAASSGDESYLSELKKISKGFQIFFYPNLPYKQLILLYEESSIYWHASGYGETDPSKMEHFGITTVEGMAAGCVPIVIKKGGQLEIVEEGKSGFFWDTPKELIDKTLVLIKDPILLARLSGQAKVRAKLFSHENFVQNILKLING